LLHLLGGLDAPAHGSTTFRIGDVQAWIVSSARR
jgi:hypothetical protein